ncbi:type VI secretion system baseplate subunit TssG [Alsobacter sp. SYSU BS001988]|jgi:type VI secretion system protein ImpH
MTYLEEMEQEPHRFDFLDSMRRIERSLGLRQSARGPLEGELGPDGEPETHVVEPRPRIGDSASRRDEVIVLDGAEHHLSYGQEPHLEFPASNLSRVEVERDSTRKRILIFSRFLGLLGPQGALPLAVTEEAFAYAQANDHAFPRFLDLFNHRFLQLFYRAWADARPIVHNDRPDFDRFRDYIETAIGSGSPPFRDGAHKPDGVALYAGLLGPKAKSASRLRNAIAGLFGVRAEVDEFIGTWLEFEKSERSFLGSRNSGLGGDLLLGQSSFSVQDKIRIRIFVDDLDAYARFLPDAPTCERLVDFVFFYLGDELEWDVELALPAARVEPVRLGASGALGWTTWMAPDYGPDEIRTDARFSPAERAARRRRTSE